MIDDSLRRRYLLGEAREEECAALEQAFVHDPEELERMTAAEELLIEDHIDGTLDEHERQRFESHYLAAPQHRERVSTTRRLLAAAGASSPPVQMPARLERNAGPGVGAWFAAAAALLLVVAGVAWMISGRQGTGEAEIATSAPPPPVASPSTEAPTGPPVTPPSVPAPPRVFAIMLSSSTVRGADDRPAVVIPANTDLVALRLEAEPGRGRPGGLVVVVKTIGGTEIWRGAATPGTNPGVIARVDIPAAHLPADDYIVELLATGATPPTTGLDRYFLSVRRR